MKISLKRKIIIKTLEFFVRTEVFFKFLKPANCLTILNYHRICLVEGDFMLDKGVVSTSPGEFEQQMQFCKDRFSIITFKDLLLIVNKEKKCPPRPMIITFDDRYVDNYQYAFPILKKLAIPACFFVSIDYIGSGKMFWWDVVAVFCNIKKDLDVVSWFHAKGLNLSLKGSGLESLSTLIHKKLKNLSDDARKEIIKAMELETQQVHNLKRSIMNWEEIKEMFNFGMEFGSHTMTHPVLSKIGDPVKLNWEILESKNVLKNNLGVIDPLVFSYPVGGTSAINTQCVEAVKNSGYVFAVSYQNGVNKINNMDFFLMKRMHIDGLSMSEFKIKMLVPSLF